jgi:hypothetical protein
MLMATTRVAHSRLWSHFSISICLPSTSHMNGDVNAQYGGAGDLASLTTLIDAAELIGADVRRLAEAEREVDAIVRRPLGAGGTG